MDPIEIHGGDVIYLYNTLREQYVLQETVDIFERQDSRKIMPFPTYGPDKTDAQQFQVLIVSDPPMTRHSHRPEDRAKATTDSTGPLLPGTAFRLLRSAPLRSAPNKNPQFMTMIQGLGQQNLTVASRPVVVYSTADDNLQGSIYTASGAKAFTPVSILTFYSKAALTFPEVPAPGNYTLEPSINERIFEHKTLQWSMILAEVTVLRGCERRSTVGMTISPEAVDSDGGKVFRNPEECNAYRQAFPVDYVIGWQCTNTGGSLGVNRCISVTQYTTNPMQPLFKSAGECLENCSMVPEALGAPQVPSEHSVSLEHSKIPEESRVPSEHSVPLEPGATMTIIIFSVLVLVIAFVVLFWVNCV